MPKGGPDGGDGGRGGDVVLVAQPDLRDLSRFRTASHFRAQRGVHGQGSGKHGRGGQDRELEVPVGTQVRLRETGEPIADLAHAGARVTVARGGLGGQGNRRYATARHRAPETAQVGEPGRGAVARAAPEARGRRRAPRIPERRQVVAPAPHLERDAEGGRLPVHDDRAGARHGRVGGRPPAHRRRRPRPARGCEPGRRPGARVPGPSRAGAAPHPPDRRVRRRRGHRRAAQGHRPRARLARRRARPPPAAGRALEDRPGRAG